jgi:uncharacterized protein DUF3140
MTQKVKPIDPGSNEADSVRNAFGGSVNMTAKQLEGWLTTDESKSVGQKDGGESVGHESGRRIVAILRKRKADLDASDIAHMKKVNGYIARHLEQRPKRSWEQLQSADWTYSLRNWGHDPLKRGD